MLGIIGAMPVEVETLVAAMENPEKMIISRMEYWKGQLCGTEVVICRSGVGKVAAAVSAQILVSVFGVDAIINTGIGGGLEPDMKQYDFVVASAAVQHDMDTSAVGDPVGWISGIDLIVLPVDEKLSGLMNDCAKNMGLNVRRGIVATGDQFVSDAGRSACIVANFKASVCDMEGGAIAQVCYMAGVPFAAVRCVSDNADGSTGATYWDFAAETAKRCSALTMEFVGRLGEKKDAKKRREKKREKKREKR